MKKALILAATAVVLTTLSGASAFADERSPEGTWRDGGYRRDSSRDPDRDRMRDDDRVTVSGRVTRAYRDRGGWRVDIDRDRRSIFIPESRLGGRDVRVGVIVQIRGIFRDGIVYADDVDYGYGDPVVRGVVDRVNYHLNYLILREWDGGYVKVDTRPLERLRRGIDTDDLRRGDAVEISGDWTRDGLFRAERVERMRSRW